MNFASMDGKEMRALEMCADHRFAAGCFAAVRKVVEQFDGKVYNCRFDKAVEAIQTADGRKLHCYKYSRFVEVYVYPVGNYNRQYTICHIDLEKLENKRINASLIVDDMRKRREEHLQKAAELEIAREHVERVKKRMEEIDLEVKSLMDGMSWEVRDLYGMNYHLRNG